MIPSLGFFSFRHFRTRLIVFLIVLLFPILGGIFYYVNENNTEYTEETINSLLELGADVFDFTRDQHALTLQAITSSLTWDYGFRTAYASQDPATIFDAALNVMDRSLNGVDMLMIVDMEYQVLIDTETQGFENLDGAWRSLLDAADASDEGLSDMIITIGGEPFQLIALPLYLPRQVAWIIGGFALDQEFVDQVRETTLSEISLLRREAGGQPELIVSTLPGNWQELLAGQIRFDTSVASSLQRMDFLGEEFTSLIRPLYGEVGDPLQVFAVIQRSYDENNANVVQFRSLLFRFYSLVLVLSLIAVLWLARSITNPVSKLAYLVKQIEEGDYERSVKVNSRDELGELATSVNSMARGLAEKEKVRDLLGKVVSQQIAEQLLSNPVELGGEERVATILFSDIRGFTSFCEGKSPKEVLETLNEVLSRISNIIEAHQGVVDKFNGDAVMALFGAPIAGERDTANAMAAALEIAEALSSTLSDTPSGTEARLSACVGITTGLVVAGNLGSSNRLNYSVIGDTVNLSARLEGLTRHYHVDILVSETSTLAAPEFVYRELDRVCVAGKSESITIFELVAPRDKLSSEQAGELEKFQLALQCYREQNWGEAEVRFSELQGKCDNKALYQIYLDRIHEFRQQPPAPDWQGIFVFNNK